jgi:Predicted membrane protein (DUF2232)
MVGVETTSNRSKGAGQLMIANIAIAIAAGCASALMYASVVSRVRVSLALLYLAPLPLMVASIGWGPLAGATGGIAAACGIALLFGLPYAISYVLMAALPAWWLGHLIMLGRPVANATPAGNGATPAAPAMEWYPTGRLLLWIAGFGFVTTLAALLPLGTDAAEIAATMREGLLAALRARGLDASADMTRVVNLLVAAVPAFMVMGIMKMLTINLWLAGKIAATSGRLNRSWPDVRSTTMPPMTMVALCIALAFSFSGGLLGLVAQVASSALLMAYALTGFAVLHTLTLAAPGRAVWLGITYVVMLTLLWPIIVMVVLGLADAMFGFRERYMRSRPPPLPLS